EPEGAGQRRRETFRIGGLEGSADSQRGQRRVGKREMPAVVAIELGYGLVERFAAELQFARGPGEATLEQLWFDAADGHVIRQQHRGFACGERRDAGRARGR